MWGYGSKGLEESLVVLLNNALEHLGHNINSKTRVAQTGMEGKGS